MVMDADTKRCPMCGSSVAVTALACQVCGEEFRPIPVESEPSTPARLALYGLSIGAIILAIGMFCAVAVVAVIAIFYVLRGAIDLRQFRIPI